MIHFRFLIFLSSLSNRDHIVQKCQPLITAILDREESAEATKIQKDIYNLRQEAAMQCLAVAQQIDGIIQEQVLKQAVSLPEFVLFKHLCLCNHIGKVHRCLQMLWLTKTDSCNASKGIENEGESKQSEENEGQNANLSPSYGHSQFDGIVMPFGGLAGVTVFALEGTKAHEMLEKQTTREVNLPMYKKKVRWGMYAFKIHNIFPG